MLEEYTNEYRRETGYFDKMAEKIAGIINKPVKKVLDIGCGFGDFLSSLRIYLGDSIDYYGITISKKEYEELKDRGLKILMARQEDLEKLFEPESFDLVINYGTFRYIDENVQIQVLEQMQKILKKDGILFLCLITTVATDKGHYSMDATKIKDKLKEYNFELKEEWLSERDSYLNQIWIKH
jgi:cyclopropane fatty-acyl-phospholipid synthase-like methyltransferase